jgi:hypothetical protein
MDWSVLFVNPIRVGPSDPRTIKKKRQANNLPLWVFLGKVKKYQHSILIQWGSKRAFPAICVLKAPNPNSVNPYLPIKFTSKNEYQLLKTSLRSFVSMLPKFTQKTLCLWFDFPLNLKKKNHQYLISSIDKHTKP